MEAKNRQQAEKNRRGTKKGSRRSNAGFAEEFSDDDDDIEEIQPVRRKGIHVRVPLLLAKASNVKLTAKEKKIDELTKRANEVKSRFSISSYYTSQLKEATPEMLESMSMTVDPETGEVVKKTKKGTKKVGAAPKVKKEEEMILESEGSESEDDVIRDNRAAIKKKQEELKKLEEEKLKKSDEKPQRGRKPATKAIESSDDEPQKDTKNSSKEVDISKSESEDEDGYIPLAKRLKMKMKDENSIAMVDDLASTKSVVPASRKRKAPVKPKGEEQSKKRVRTKKEESASSDDSLFGF